MAAVAKEIDERAFQFLCNAIRFVRSIRSEPGVRRLIEQFVASAGSIAANREEASCASSRREFVRFNEIALRSANESVLLLRAFTATEIGKVRQGSVLLDEARQLSRILAAIIVRTKQNL